MKKIQEIQKPCLPYPGPRNGRQARRIRGGRGVIIILISLLAFPSTYAQIEKVKIGMSHDEFNAVMENLIPGKNNYNGYIKGPLTISNLPFEMHGEIKDDTLRNIWASSETVVDFEKEGSEAHIQQSLENYDHCIKYLALNFTRYYGESTPTKNTTRSFQLNKETPSDTLYKCEWSNSSRKVILTFLYKNAHRGQNAYQINPYPNANAAMERSQLRIYFHIEGTEEKENITGLKCGMNAATVYKENKSLMPKGYFTTGKWTKSANLYGVEDEFQFEFESGKLVNYSFEKELYDSDMYDEEHTLTTQKFTRFIASSRSLILEYKKTYGNPVSSETGPATLEAARKKMDEIFKDTAYGKESVIINKASWKQGEQEISISVTYNKWVSKDTRVTLEYMVEVK